MKRGTMNEVIRAQCRRCLGIGPGVGYDCLDASCLLYPAMAWRGRNPHQTQQPGGPLAHEVKRMAALAKSHPKRRPSKVLIARHCRECLAEGEDDCPVADCPLWPWRPFQPGGQPKLTNYGYGRKPETPG